MNSSDSSSKLHAVMSLPFVLAKDLLTAFDERILNIRTVERRPETEQQPSSLFGDNEEYSTINYWFIRRIIRETRPSPDDVFYDLGCGMGRVLCMFSRRKLRKCVGIEYDRYHYACSRMNALRLRGRRSPIEVRCEDAACSDVSDGTIFYMFNPFGSSTLGAVLENIAISLRRKPRRIVIIYVNPVHCSLMESCGWLHLYHDFHTLLNLRVTFWTNNRTAAATTQHCESRSPSCSE